MKVLLINGSAHEKGCTYTALSEVAARLKENGIEAQIFHIGSKVSTGCIACSQCRKPENSGHCTFTEDKVNECIDLISDADAVVFGSPVYYAGPSGNFLAFLDRVFFAKKSFAGKLGASVVSCRRGGASATYDRLNKYFGISQMPIVTSQYWNSVHGNTPEEVKQDLEGMQTMRVLADNMTWLLKSIEAGKKAGLTFPTSEPKINTNFIR